MQNMKPTFIKENGKAKFVVFSMKDYAIIKGVLEDAEDARILDKARRRGAAKPTTPQSEILKEFGLARPARKTRKVRSSSTSA